MITKQVFDEKDESPRYIADIGSNIRFQKREELHFHDWLRETYGEGDTFEEIKRRFRSILPEEDLPMYESCAVVGSAPDLLAHKDGAEIDSFAAVIRTNSAFTQGFEEYVGTKTTIRIVSEGYIFWRGNTAPSYTARDMKGEHVVYLDFPRSSESINQILAEMEDFSRVGKPLGKVHLMSRHLDWFCTIIWNVLIRSGASQGCGSDCYLGKSMCSSGLIAVALAITKCKAVKLYGYATCPDEMGNYFSLREHYYDGNMKSPDGTYTEFQTKGRMNRYAASRSFLRTLTHMCDTNISMAHEGDKDICRRKSPLLSEIGGSACRSQLRGVLNFPGRSLFRGAECSSPSELSSKQCKAKKALFLMGRKCTQEMQFERTPGRECEELLRLIIREGRARSTRQMAARIEQPKSILKASELLSGMELHEDGIPKFFSDEAAKLLRALVAAKEAQGNVFPLPSNSNHSYGGFTFVEQYNQHPAST